MIDAEGSALLAVIFNKMTIAQKNSVDPEHAERIGKFMSSNGYCLVFDRWYLQAPPEPNECSWQSIETAPKDGTLVLIVMDDGEVLTARNLGDATQEHNGWWTQDGLDLGYGSSNPLGWLPRDLLARDKKYPPGTIISADENKICDAELSRVIERFRALVNTG